MVLDFKFSVLINGTKQFNSSCNYIFSTERMTDQILMCDLQCKVERAFSDHEWNEVEILCELKYPIPCGSEREMATQDGTAMIPSWSLIYVYEENMEDIKFLPLSQECKEAQRRKETLFGFHSMLNSHGLNWIGF
ncbi:disease resistance protein [Sesbania bispinosa]|nr:disease resistance protein [Sesbania bispinosa]